MGISKKIWLVLFLLLGIYSAVLLSLELQHGNEYVRGYFSDIKSGVDYPLPFTLLYGVNTTLTVVLLSAVALLFLVCIGGRNGIAVYPAQNVFEWFQVVFFAYVACDERFMVHEIIGNKVPFDDVFIIAALGLLEFAVLMTAGQIRKRSWRVRGWLLAATVFFGVMVILDGLLPTSFSEALAPEDLSKTWACLCLFFFAWNYCMESISLQQKKECNES